MGLSRRRAESVKKYMVDLGIDAKHLETEGRGPDQPLNTNETNSGRANNRRKEFQFLEEDSSVETKPGKADKAK